MADRKGWPEGEERAVREAELEGTGGTQLEKLTAVERRKNYSSAWYGPLV